MTEKKRIAYIVKRTEGQYEDQREVVDAVLLGPEGADMTALLKEYYEKYSTFQQWLISEKGFEDVPVYNP